MRGYRDHREDRQKLYEEVKTAPTALLRRKARPIMELRWRCGVFAHVLCAMSTAFCRSAVWCRDTLVCMTCVWAFRQFWAGQAWSACWIFPSICRSRKSFYSPHTPCKAYWTHLPYKIPTNCMAEWNDRPASCGKTCHVFAGNSGKKNGFLCVCPKFCKRHHAWLCLCYNKTISKG